MSYLKIKPTWSVGDKTFNSESQAIEYIEKFDLGVEQILDKIDNDSPDVFGQGSQDFLESCSDKGLD